MEEAQVGELGSFLQTATYYMKILENELQKGLKDFVMNYANAPGNPEIEKTKGSTKLYSPKPGHGKKKSEQEIIEEATQNYFSFIDTYVLFINSSKQLKKLHIDEMLIGVAIDELLTYWLKRYIVPNVQKFTLDAIEASCQKVAELVAKYRNNTAYC